VHEPFETLIAAAIRAPSGDNTQPWRFVVDTDGRRIELHVDESRDPSPMNAGQRMSRLALGAALENMIRAAESLGWDIELDDPPAPALASVRLVECPPAQRELDPTITARVTNRHVYDGRALSWDLAAKLEHQTPDQDGVCTHWIVDRDRISALASLIGRSDALMLGEPSMRRAFLENIRFDLPWGAEAEEGLSLASLELSTPDRLALRIIPRIPNWLLKIGGAARKFAATGCKLVASSSGICVVVEPDGKPESELIAGRAMQRAWLALTAHGLAAQPMMSLAILESVVSRGTPQLLASLGRERAEALVEEFRNLVADGGRGSIAFIMRFGFAPPPTAVTKRLPLFASVIRTPASARALS